MEFKEKLKLLRKSEAYTQKKFAEILDIGYSTLGHYESGRSEPTQSVMQNLCKKFPHYTLWIMTDEIDLPNQTSPIIKLQQDTYERVLEQMKG